MCGVRFADFSLCQSNPEKTARRVMGAFTAALAAADNCQVYDV